MEPPALGIVFGPNLMRAEIENAESFQNMQYQVRARARARARARGQRTCTGGSVG